VGFVSDEGLYAAEGAVGTRAGEMFIDVSHASVVRF